MPSVGRSWRSGGEQRNVVYRDGVGDAATVAEQVVKSVMSWSLIRRMCYGHPPDRCYKPRDKIIELAELTSARRAPGALFRVGR